MRPLRVLVGVLLMAGLAACGSTETAAPGDAAPASGAAPFRTVKHAMGETVIPTQPKRVVALDQSFVDAVLTLETPVVGYTTYRSIETKLPDYLGPLVGQYVK